MSATVDIAADFLVRFLIVLAYGLVPGAALLAFVRCRFASNVDEMLACIATSMAWTVFWVQALLFCGLYQRSTAALIVLAPAGWLAWLMLWKGYRPAEARALDRPRPRIPPIDHVVVIAIAASLFLFLADAGTSPITSWDGDVTWDKWAADWGRRSDLYGYLVGGYPQMLPMFSSVLYKLTGASLQAIPLEQFVLHATQAVYCFILLASLVRLAQLFELPAWPVILLTFGNLELRASAMNVTADLMLVMFTAVAFALYVSYIKGNWESRYGLIPVLAPALFGVCFTKGNGVLVLLIPLSFFVLHRRLSLDRYQIRQISRRTTAATVLLPLVACLPFYLYQITASDAPANLNPHEINFAPSGMASRLAYVVASSYQKPSLVDKISTATERLLRSFGDVGRWPLLAMISSTVLLVMSLRNRIMLPLVLPMLAMFWVWFQFASYDARNVLFALPIAGIAATAGGVELEQLVRRNWGAGEVLVVCWTLMAAPLALDIADSATGVTHLFDVPPESLDKRSTFAHRIGAMSADADARAKLHFPDEWPTYSLVKSLPVAKRATTIFAIGRMYRWLPNGAYPLSEWHAEWVRPGDLFVGVPPHLPPDYDRWSLIGKTQRMQIWLRDASPRSIPLNEVLLAGQTPPKVLASTSTGLDLQLHGTQGLMVYNVPDRYLGHGSSVVWRVLVEATTAAPGLAPYVSVYNRAIIDPWGTSTVTDADLQRINPKLFAYSGILTFSGRPLSRNMTDEILVGMASTQDNATIRLREFRVSIYQ